MEWTVETLNGTVDAELRALPHKMRARFARICQLIAAVGLERMDAPHVRHLTGPALGNTHDRPCGHIASALCHR